MQSSPVAVTVIIPMQNEELRIERCLNSVLANDFPHNQLEVLVIDGMSSDRSREIAETYAACFSCVRVLVNEGKIVSCGLNIGIRQAQGQTIIIMGAHAEYPANYISTCVAELLRTGADVVGGVLQTCQGADTLTGHAIALMTQHPFGVGRSAFRTRDAGRYVDTVPYGAYRREVFDRIGGFNEKLVRNQDFEFNARVYKGGGRLFLSRDLEVIYYNSPDFRSLARQAFRNGFWLPHMWRVSPASFRLRHAAPLFLVIMLAASFLAALHSSWAILAAIGLLITYGLATLFVAWQIAALSGGKCFFPLVCSFFTQHALYGLGTLCGAISSIRPRMPRDRIKLTEAATH